MMQGFTATTEPSTTSSRSATSPVWCCEDTAQLHSLVAMKELNDSKCQVLSEMNNGRILTARHSDGEASKKVSVNAANLKHFTVAPVTKRLFQSPHTKSCKDEPPSSGHITTPVATPASARKQTADFLRWRNSSVRFFMFTLPFPSAYVQC